MTYRYENRQKEVLKAGFLILQQSAVIIRIPTFHDPNVVTEICVTDIVYILPFTTSTFITP